MFRLNLNKDDYNGLKYSLDLNLDVDYKDFMLLSNHKKNLMEYEKESSTSIESVISKKAISFCENFDTYQTVMSSWIDKITVKQDNYLFQSPKYYIRNALLNISQFPDYLLSFVVSPEEFVQTISLITFFTVLCFMFLLFIPNIRNFYARNIMLILMFVLFISIFQYYYITKFYRKLQNENIENCTKIFWFFTKCEKAVKKPPKHAIQFLIDFFFDCYNIILSQFIGSIDHAVDQLKISNDPFINSCYKFVLYITIPFFIVYCLIVNLPYLIFSFLKNGLQLAGIVPSLHGNSSDGTERNGSNVPLANGQTTNNIVNQYIFNQPFNMGHMGNTSQIQANQTEAIEYDGYVSATEDLD